MRTADEAMSQPGMAAIDGQPVPWSNMEQQQLYLGLLLFRPHDLHSTCKLLLPSRTVSKISIQHAGGSAALASYVLVALLLLVNCIASITDRAVMARCECILGRPVLQEASKKCSCTLHLLRHHSRHKVPQACSNSHAILHCLRLQVQEIQHFYASRFAFSKAHAHLHLLEQQGFQPGAVCTGVMRTKLLQRMSKGVVGLARLQTAHMYWCWLRLPCMQQTCTVVHACRSLCPSL